MGDNFIKSTCGKCGATMTLAASYSGQTVKCIGCGNGYIACQKLASEVTDLQRQIDQKTVARNIVGLALIALSAWIAVHTHHTTGYYRANMDLWARHSSDEEVLEQWLDEERWGRETLSEDKKQKIHLDVQRQYLDFSHWVDYYGGTRGEALNYARLYTTISNLTFRTDWSTVRRLAADMDNREAIEHEIFDIRWSAAKWMAAIGAAIFFWARLRAGLKNLKIFWKQLDA